MLVTSQKNGCYHRIGYLTERLKTQCLSQKSENVSVAQWIERCPPKARQRRFDSSQGRLLRAGIVSRNAKTVPALFIF